MHNAGSVGVGGSGPSFGAMDEKRRLAMRERDPQVEGPPRVTFVSGNDEDLLPPAYHQVTNPFITEQR